MLSRFVSLYTMKSFSDNFTRIGYEDKCFRLVFLDEVTKLYSLRPVERGKDDILIFTGKCTLCQAYGGTAAKCMDDEVTDWLRCIADYIKIFRKVKAFNKVIDHERANCKAEEGIQPCFNVKHKAARHSNQDISYEKCAADIKAGILFQDHGNDIGTSAGRTNIK